MTLHQRPAKRGITVVEILVIVGILALLIALLLPAVRTAGPAARRSQCTNNMKQIGLGLYNYESAHHCLPPAYTVDANGKPLHSWRTLILPYMEHEAIYKEIDLSKPWDDPVNSTSATRRISSFLCPSAMDGGAKTNYLAIVGEGGYLAPGRPRRVAEITDGLATTVAVVEVRGKNAVPWMAPFDTNAEGYEALIAKMKPSHPGGANVTLGDGSVRFLKTDTPVTMLRAMATISGNDNDFVKAW